jgi:hypothetical protein
MKKIIRLSIVGLVVFLSIFIYARYYFVLGEGVKAGDLNYIVHKGYIFKTWEGKVIQTGIKSYTPGAIQSNEFEFSIASDSVAKRLELNSGKFVELRYKEYIQALPWRGNSKYVVSEIISVRETTGP